MQHYVCLSLKFPAHYLLICDPYSLKILLQVFLVNFDVARVVKMFCQNLIETMQTEERISQTLTFKIDLKPF